MLNPRRVEDIEVDASLLILVEEMLEFFWFMIGSRPWLQCYG